MGDLKDIRNSTAPDSRRAARARREVIAGTRPGVLVDRDGTIIVEHHHLTDPKKVELLPGAADALRRLRALGMPVIVVTNQSVVGRGLIDERRLGEIHGRMRALLEIEGAAVDAILYCPHHPSAACRCRKPNPGLVERATMLHGIDPQQSYVVGDNRCDVDLALRVGAVPILVLTGHGARTAAVGVPSTVTIVGDLPAAAARIAAATHHAPGS